MADKRVIEEQSSTELYSDDWFLKDSATNGTRKILVSRLKELLCGDYIADEWVAGETYTNGAIVSHEGKLYYNKSGGTLVQITFNSNSWLEVKIDELLEKVIGSIGEKWRRVDTYHYDDLVVYGGRLYRCIKNASTQGTWVSNEWIEANAEYYFKKVREYIARYGFVPSREAISSPYNKGDLILYGAPGDTTNSLYMRLNDTEHGDPTWIPENWLKVENIGGALSKIYDDMAESDSIDDIVADEVSLIDENKVADLTPLAAVGSASGAIATFDDGSDLPMPKLEVAIEPQQDLHGYDSPWVGGSGKNKCNPNIDGWNNGTYKYIKLPNFNDDNYIMSFVDKDTSVDLAGISFGFMYNYPAVNYQYRWVINSGRIQSNKTNISQVDGTTKCDTLIIYPNTTDAFNKLFSRYNIQVEKGTTATAFAPYSNICPISGWDEVNVEVSGVNVWDEEWELINGRVSSKNYIPVKPNTTYFLNNTLFYNARMYDVNKTLIRNAPFVAKPNGFELTMSADCYYLKFEIANLYGTTYNNDISINYPSTDTSYHAYNGQTYTIDLDGTRYGGTLDVVSGKLTVDRAYVDLGTLNWTYSSETNRERFSSALSDVKWVSDSIPINAICSALVVTDFYTVYNHITDNTIGMWHGTTLAVYSSAYTDVATFKTAMDGVKLVYELATPTTIQLTPTQVKSLLGSNNVWADTGDVLDAEYIRDATTIINSLIARIEALENQ